jgi:hypothetical protein
MPQTDEQCKREGTTMKRLLSLLAAALMSVPLAVSAAPAPA